MADPRDQETIDFSASTVAGASGAVVGLTVLCHPNLARVGEVSALFSLGVGGARKLSRLEPDFHAHGHGRAEPLLSPVMSRTAIVVRGMDPETVVIENPAALGSVTVQGRPLGAEQVVRAAELGRGVVLALSGCVLLLLHTLSADRDVLPNMGLFGESLEIRRVREEIRRVADLDACVLIRGESGSGKELVARAIHEQSRRRGGPYVTVNMGAIPIQVGASMLFGHARGAFTGAAQPSPGFFGSAEGGTLFLDEVGETPRDLQGALLRALREGEIQPVGEPRTRTVDVRVVSATDADLAAMVERGQFAMPLLRRLEGYTIAVPPLRERRDDLARLFVRFLRDELTATGELHKLDEPPPSQKPWLPASLVAALLEYTWPGNVAELETIAKRLVIINRGHATFQLDTLISQRLDAGRHVTGGASAASSTPTTSSPAAVSTSTLEPRARSKDPASLQDEEIARVMRDHQFKIKAAANALGVSRSWLNNRLENCQGIRKAKDLGREEIIAAARDRPELAVLAERLEVSEHGLKLRLKALDLPLDG